jgi:hypothetical protein
MPASDLFGKIALRKGLLSEDQLYRVLRFQEEVRALGLRKPLGEICLMQGALKPDQVEQILRLQRLNEKAQAQRRFGVTAVANGFVSAEQLESALAVARKESFRRSLAEIMVREGSITAATARALELAVKRRALFEVDDAPTEEDPQAGRLAEAIDVDGKPQVNVEQRVDDVLFAAIALRDGHLLAPELARCLREQLAQASPPPLSSVLSERGILDAPTTETIHKAARESQREQLSIPGYELLDVLGGGATSIVLRARHALIDREVAIKLIRADRVEVGADDLIEEAKTIARLRHPHVVGLYEVGRVHRRLFFVMELIDGPTLLDVVHQQGPLGERRALEVARDVAQALEAVEEAGLVHRDVKPGNIMLPPEGPAKLTDLGLALDTRRPGRDDPKAIYGTPHTMSPEQANGDPVDIRADLYGLGATLYQALVGEPPFVGDKPLEVLLAHLTASVPDPRAKRPDLGDDTARFVMRLLAKRPQDRPGSPAQAGAELAVILG